MSRVPLIVALAALSAAGALAASQQPQTFRGGVQSVPVYVTVVDRYDEIVKDLGRDDFEIDDNGERRDVTLFSSGLHPITAVLLLDTSSSMTLNVDAMKRAAEQFAVRLLPDDRARIGSFSDRIKISPLFTSDRDALLRIVQNDIEIGNPTLLWDAIDEGLSAAEGREGRRVVIVFTDGVDTISRKSPKDVARHAQIEGLAVYGFWMRGNFRLVWDRPMRTATSRQMETGAALIEDMAGLARNTGGAMFDMRQTGNLEYRVNHLAEELRFQYELAFAPAKLDGKMHDIEVHVKNEKARHLTVRARRSYLAK